MIQREADVIRKICGKGAHPHIISVFKLGELRNSHYYFIDMELCDLNLADFIKGPASPDASIPVLIKNSPPSLRALQVWNIMSHIAKGLVYLHSVRVVHRDLNPSNGTISENILLT